MKRIVLSFTMTFGFVVGCADGSKEVVISESAFNDGLNAFDDKQYDEAESMFTHALKVGALNVDSMCEARLKRAKARMELGDFDGAQEDLEFLKEGAPDTTVVLAMQGELALKQGQTDEAKRFYNEARKSDPRLPIPVELR